jgi:hypothetical protein
VQWRKYVQIKGESQPIVGMERGQFRRGFRLSFYMYVSRKYGVVASLRALLIWQVTRRRSGPRWRSRSYVGQNFDAGEVALFNPTTSLDLDGAAQKIAEDGFKEHAKLYMICLLHAQRLHSLIQRFGTPTLGR